MGGRLFYCGVALLSASSWALGSILWRRIGDELPSAAMNLARTSIGAAFLLAAAPAVVLGGIDGRTLALLSASGLLGIALGDTFFFQALMRMGPRRASLMGPLNTAAIVLSAALFLGERPGPAAWAGIVLTTTGVGWVLRERFRGREETGLLPGGIRYGLLSVLCTAAAILLAKAGLAAVPALRAAWIRLAAGAAGLALWGASRSQLGSWVEPLRKGALLARLAVASAVVVFGGFWLSLVALKHLDAAVATTLSSTAPLFVLPMSAVLSGERPSVRAVLGAAVAVGGVALTVAG